MPKTRSDLASILMQRYPDCSANWIYKQIRNLPEELTEEHLILLDKKYRKALMYKQKTVKPKPKKVIPEHIRMELRPEAY
jgi:hypothetical protein